MQLTAELHQVYLVCSWGGSRRKDAEGKFDVLYTWWIPIPQEECSRPQGGLYQSLLTEGICGCLSEALRGVKQSKIGVEKGCSINKRHQFPCRRKLQIASQTHQSLENFCNRLCIFFWWVPRTQTFYCSAYCLQFFQNRCCQTMQSHGYATAVLHVVHQQTEKYGVNRTLQLGWTYPLTSRAKHFAMDRYGRRSSKGRTRIVGDTVRLPQEERDFLV